MSSHHRQDKNHVNLMHWLYRQSRTSSSEFFFVFYSQGRHENEKNDVSLCKLDVNGKNRTAVTDSVGFL